MATNSEVTIRFATAEDEQTVRAFIREYFYKDEPMCHYLKILEESPINEDMERFSFQSYGQGLDLVAEYNGRVVGVCLNGLLERGTVSENFQFVDKNNKFEKIVRLLEHLEASVDYFGRYPEIDRLMMIQMLAVDSSMRGKGISKKLKERTIELAKEHKAGLCVTECSSYYSARVSKDLGFELIHTLNYADYKVNGEVVFKLEPPHKAATVYVSKIDL